MISLRKHNKAIKILRQQRNVRPDKLLSIFNVISSRFIWTLLPLHVDIAFKSAKQCDCPKSLTDVPH